MSATLKTRSGRLVELPTPEEDARINAGIAADPDAPELDDAWFARARPASEALPPEVYQGLLAIRRRRGERGPQKAPTKVATTIRLSPEVSAAFRATGPGWQTRIDEALKDWLRTHDPA
ncbi:MAG: BrnA antitoxin family protein [Ottowia sp.]|uniref:BrnA antitoxin family protein n=1 Tax=Ottowia sp. TaxID=1898956 RepID=UPI0039E5D478